MTQTRNEAERKNAKSKRLNGEGSINPVKGRDLYRGRIRLTFPNKSSKQVQVYDRSKVEVKRKMQRLRKLAKKGILNSNETVEEYLNRWFHDDTLAPTSVMNRQANIKRIVPIIGEVKVQELGKSHIQYLLASLKENGLSENSRRQVRDVLRKALNDAVEEDLIEEAPSFKVKSKPQPKSAQKNPLADYEIELLLSEDDDKKPIWVTFIYAGLRPSELIALRWANVNLKSESINVCEQVQRIKGECVVSEPKWGSIRKVPMRPQLLDALTKHYENQDPSLRRDDLVFPNTSGTYLNHSVIREWFHKRLKALSLSHHTLDNLRETFATIMTEQEGFPDSAVSQLMGHTSTTTTKENYTKHSYSYLHEKVTSMV